MIRFAAALLASISLTTASAHADAIAVSVSPDPVQNVAFPITATWAATSNLSPQVYVTVKPSGPGCAVNFYADFPSGKDVIWMEGADVSGSATGSYLAAVPGSYTVCAYLQDTERSEAPYAASGPIVVTVRAPDAPAPAPTPAPDPCPPARAAVGQASDAVAAAQRAVKRDRVSYQRAERRAKRASGANRRHLQRLATHSKTRYRAAVRLRATAQAALAQAQVKLIAACPG